MDKKIRRKLISRGFRFCFVFALLSFLALYFSQATGYYDFAEHKKVTLTNEQIKKFEDDVASGKNLNLEDYLSNTDKNYQNKTSRMGLKISESIGTYARKGIEATFKVLNKLVE